MSEKQVPSVRRLVTYWAYGTPGGEYPSNVDRAAMITLVHDPRALAEGEAVDPDWQPDVSLAVFNPSGFFFNQDVPYTPYDKPQGGHWSWPPRV